MFYVGGGLREGHLSVVYDAPQKLPARLEREVRRADKAIAAIDEAAYVLSDDRGRLSAPRKRRSRPPVEDGAKPKALGCAASSHAAAPAADEEESSEPPAGKHKAHHDVPDDGAIVSGRWTEAEHHLFLAGIQKHGFKWSKVAAEVPTRTVEQIKSHAQKHFRKSDQPEAQAVWGDGSMNSIPAHSSMADASRAAHVSGGSSAVITAAGAGGNSLDTLAQAARTQGASSACPYLEASHSSYFPLIVIRKVGNLFGPLQRRSSALRASRLRLMMTMMRSLLQFCAQNRPPAVCQLSARNRLRNVLLNISK